MTDWQIVIDAPVGRFSKAEIDSAVAEYEMHARAKDQEWQQWVLSRVRHPTGEELFWAKRRAAELGLL